MPKDVRIPNWVPGWGQGVSDWSRTGCEGGDAEGTKMIEIEYRWKMRLSIDHRKTLSELK